MGRSLPFFVPFEYTFFYFSLSKYVYLKLSHRKDGKWKHEIASEMMFDYLVRDNNIPISEKDQRFIKALIAGEPSRT